MDPLSLGRGFGENDVALVVVTYNSVADVAGLIASLDVGLAGIDRSELVVVDNASSDGTADEVARLAPWATLVRAADNRGFAAGLNAGFAAARPARAVLVLNADVRLQQDCVARMLRGLGRPGVGIVAPRMLDADGHLFPSLRREPTLIRALAAAVLGGRRVAQLAPLSETVTDPGAYAAARMADWATGAVLLVSTTCWRDVGGWDESFFLFSEEVDFALRARDLGYRTAFEPTAVATHIGGITNSQDPMMYALLTSNRVRQYAKRHSAVATKAYSAALLLHETLRALQRGEPHWSARAAVAAASAGAAAHETMAALGATAGQPVHPSIGDPVPKLLRSDELSLRSQST
ncbi:GT2 family glycosyltransferase [Geodermatophilus normandii]|uniref:GT2 family glycosyltransferase n=1 Tax=Geodermatophilus normandii TaxID=1137989 RepID=A0A317QFK2_9ACTN|nr:glycosyltransferase family 2 protein [Geodermatophilus normandii]PWW21376.1 GT2 family glycosyltransferase [Geodermatophilus normandii]